MSFQERPIIITTLFKKLQQAGDCGVAFDQRILSTFSIPWCKNASSQAERMPQMFAERSRLCLVFLLHILWKTLSPTSLKFCAHHKVNVWLLPERDALWNSVVLPEQCTMWVLRYQCGPVPQPTFPHLCTTAILVLLTPLSYTGKCNNIHFGGNKPKCRNALRG